MDDFTVLSKLYTETISTDYAVVLTVIVITASKHLISTVRITYGYLVSGLTIFQACVVCLHQLLDL